MCHRFHIIVLFISFSAFSQQKDSVSEKRSSLDTVLSEIEVFYKIKFSYNVDILTGQSVHPIKKRSLEDDLIGIQRQTSVFFKKLDAGYYAILAKDRYPGFKRCGYIFDKNANQPIAQCTIQNSEGSLITKTDDRGYFEFFISNSKEVLDIDHAGYKIKILQADRLASQKCDKILLISDSYQLEEVLITDYLKNDIPQPTDKNHVQVNPNEVGTIPSLVEPDVLEILQILPGVQSPDETASDLFIRGGNPDQNLILWDGIRMYGSGHFFGAFSAYNPYVAEDIKLIRGGTHPRYGGAISGVVDIRSTDEVTKELRGGGGINLTHGDIYLKAPVAKNVGLILSGRRSYIDLIKTGPDQGYLNRSFQNAGFFQEQSFFKEDSKSNTKDSYFGDLTAKIIWDISKKDLVKGSFIFNENNTIYNFNSFLDTNIVESSFKEQSDEIEGVNNGVSLSWMREWSSNFSFVLQGYNSYFRRRFQELSKTFDGESAEQENVSFMANLDSKNRVQDMGFSFLSTLKIGNSLSLEVGSEFSEIDIKTNVDYEFVSISNDVTGGFNTPIENKNISKSVFSSVKLNIKERLLTNIGIRLNDFSVFENQEKDKLYVEPRMGLQIQLNDGFRTRFSYDRKYQIAFQEHELDGVDFRLLQSNWVLVDDTYDAPPMSDQWSLGCMYSKKSIDIDVDVYHRRSKNISSRTRGFEQQLLFSFGENVGIGMDVFIKKRFKKYQTWISYTVSDQKSTFMELNDGQTFPGNFDSRHRFSWGHRIQLENFEFSVGWNYRTGLPFSTELKEFSNFGTASVEFETINDGRLTDYHRLDLSASYRFNYGNADNVGGKISIALLNVYNRKNVLGRLYIPSLVGLDENMDFEYELLQRDRRSLGFTPNISVRFNF